MCAFFSHKPKKWGSLDIYHLKEGGCLLEFLKLDGFFYLSSENKDTDKLGNLICGFVFACAKSRFYPDAAQFKDEKSPNLRLLWFNFGSMGQS